MKISASIQAANQLNLLTDIEKNSNKFDQLHVDITDGHFTQNIGLSLDIVRLLKEHTDYKVDVHLMLNKNSNYVEKVINNGADLVTVHSESTSLQEFEKLTSTYDNIGIGILPTSEMETLVPYMDLTSTYLLLTVNPGFSNQPKAVDITHRIQELKTIQTTSESTIIIDGGVTNEDLTSLKDCGVSIAVQGGAIFG